MFSDFTGEPDKARNGLAFVLPTYRAFVYSRRAIESFFKYTPEALNPVVLHYDDASPQYANQNWDAFYADLPRDRIWHIHYPVNGGLTRSWNNGLKLAKDLRCTYAIAGNSDILFTPGWYEGLMWHLDNNTARLVGPVTNAPGWTGGRGQRQDIHSYYLNYVLSDAKEELEKVTSGLREQYPLNDIRYGTINGFFMMSRVEYWWQGAFDTRHVFNPQKLMTGNEDELEKRWQAAGYKLGSVPTSYIFHYRSVSRGDQHSTDGAMRLRDPRQAV